MNKTKAIKAEAGDVAVMDEVSPLLAEIVVGFPVAANCEDVCCALLNRDDIRHGYACFFAVVVFVLVAFEV